MFAPLKPEAGTSLSERALRAENGGHHISHFLLASMGNVLGKWGFLVLLPQRVQFLPGEPHLHFIWTWTVRIFVTLGGFAGMTKILEWLVQRAQDSPSDAYS